MSLSRITSDELFALVEDRRDQVRTFLEWAAEAERSSSLRMRNRPDIRRAAEAAELFPERWWGIVVYSCFDSTKGAATVAPHFQEPLPPEHAETVLGGLDFPRGSVGGHRIQPGVTGAKRALVGACANDEFFQELLHAEGGFDERYQRLYSAHLPQWGRTTCFDLFLRAGALGIGRRRYEPEYAYLAGSTGPKSGFKKLWGREINPDNAAWGEAVLRAWTEEWRSVSARVGADWEGDPYAPADFENALCIWQERRH